jgi:hypothetical protein
VFGHLGMVEVAFYAACVDPDEQAAKVFAQLHVIVSPSVRIPREAYPRPPRRPSRPLRGRDLWALRGRDRRPLSPGFPPGKENGPVRGGETDRPEGGSSTITLRK